MDVNLVGGYDDNLAGGGIGTVDPTTMASGTVGTLDTGLAYRAGNLRHELTFDSRGTAFAYPDYLDGPALGATATAGGKVTVGRSTALAGAQTIGYEPFFSAFSPDASAAAPSLAVEQAIPVTGLFERRSVISRTAVSLTQVWSRASTTAGYAYGVRRFRGDTVGPEGTATGDNTSQSANAGFRVAVSNAVDLRADYQYTDLEFTDTLGALRPNRTHRVEGGASVEYVTGRGLLSVSATAGASRLESTPVLDAEQTSTTWVPVANASVKVPLSRSWAVDGAYRRDFALLQGLANDVYANDTVALTVGGLLARRTTVEFGTSTAIWRTPLPGTADSTARIYGGSVRIVQMLTDRVGLIASYNYYRHRFSSGSGLPAGFPSEYDRNAVRIGITLRFPMMAIHNAPAAGSR